MLNSFLTFSVAFLFSVLLFSTGCGKWKTSEGGVVISGVAQAGPIKGNIDVYVVTNGQRGEKLGSTQSDSDGNFSLNIPAQTGPVEIAATGTYTDEATGLIVDMGGKELTQIVADARSNQSTPVTPLTSLVHDTVLSALSSGKATSAQVAQVASDAITRVAQLYGVDATVITALPSNPNKTVDGTSASGKAAFILASLSQALKDNGLSPDKGNPMDALDAISKAFAQSGKIDGSGIGNSAVADLASSWNSSITAARIAFQAGSVGGNFKAIDLGQFSDPKSGSDESNSGVNDKVFKTGWAFVDGNGTDGISRTHTSIGHSVNMVAFNSKLYAIWPERELDGSRSHARVSVYGGNDATPTWTSVENHSDGLYYSATQEAIEIPPQLIVLHSKLYALWGERHPVFGIQIRVAVYGGDDSNPSWTFVDGGTAIGINKDTSKSALAPQMAVFNDQLYVIFSQYIGINTNQIRLTVYNGNDSSPSWAFVDGNHAVYGLNKNTAFHAEAPQLVVLNSKLYALWNEGFSGAVTQIRAAVFNGDNAFPAWTFVDGNGTVGINLDSSHYAAVARPLVFNNKLYVATSEQNSPLWRAHVAVYNGNDSSPTWTYVDGTGLEGLNFNSSRSNEPIQLIALGSKMYISLVSKPESITSTELRVMSYNADDAHPVWSFEDGGDSVKGINHNIEQDALFPFMAVYSSKLYCGWSEVLGHGEIWTRQIRMAVKE